MTTAITWYRLAVVDNGLVSCGNVTSWSVFQPVTDYFNLHYRTLQDGLWHDNDYDFARYRELDNDGWVYYPTLPAALDPGKGYVIRTADTNMPEKGMDTEIVNR